MTAQEASGKQNWFEQHPVKTFVCLAFVALILAEAFLQFYYYAKIKHFVFDDAYRVTNIERVDDERQFVVRKNYHSFRYHINEERYRGNLIEGDPDILMLGDSVPFASGVGDHQSYAAFLSKMYGLKVINGGVPSYTFWQSLIRWQKDFSHLKPKTVTFQSTNDLPLATYYQKVWHPRITWMGKRWDVEQTFKDHLLRNSALYYYVERAFLWLKEGGQKEDPNVRENHQPMDAALKQNFFAAIDQSFNEIIQYGADTNTVVIFIAGNLFWYTDDLEKNNQLKYWTTEMFRSFQFTFGYYQTINEGMVKKAEQFDHVYYFDVVDKMDQMDRRKLFKDPVHHTPYGNVIFAKLFYEFLQENQLLGLSKPANVNPAAGLPVDSITSQLA